MKKIILVLVIALAGCAGFGNSTTTGADQGKVNFVQNCTIYAGVLNGALQAAQAGKLNAEQTVQLKTISLNVSPICKGPVPVNTDAATAQVTAAITTLTVYEGLLKGTAK